jgi:predicted N-formylglutamate amidohydrolase
MYKFLISCEHASNHVPDELITILGPQKKLLQSHRAYDQGALDAAQVIADATGAKIISGTCTRLAVDLNRSQRNPSRFSVYSRTLDTITLKRLEMVWYHPYRDYVKNSISKIINKNVQAVHLSIHSFTPVLNGIKRETDIGLLYDPSRKPEREFAAKFKESFASTNPHLRVRCNYPYKGVSDGIASWLRKQFDETNYIGFEIELNQKLLKNAAQWNGCLQNIVDAIKSSIH